MFNASNLRHAPTEIEEIVGMHVAHEPLANTQTIFWGDPSRFLAGNRYF